MDADYKFPKIIFIVGTDGAGKTLYANMLLEELTNKGVNVQHVWSRYNNFLSKPLLALTRLTGHNYKEYHEGIEFGYHDFGKSKILSHVFIFLQIIDVNLATYFKIRRRAKRKQVLICDRGPYDSLVDVMLDTGRKSLSHRSVRMFLAALPEEHVVFYIHRPVEQIYQTRPELKYDRSLSIKDILYQNCNRHFRWITVENIGSSDGVFDQILSCLNQIHKASNASEI